MGLRMEPRKVPDGWLTTALACAIIHNLPMLFLEEATAGVAPVSRRELCKEDPEDCPADGVHMFNFFPMIRATQSEESGRAALRQFSTTFWRSIGLQTQRVRVLTTIDGVGAHTPRS